MYNLAGFTDVFKEYWTFKLRYKHCVGLKIFFFFFKENAYFSSGNPVISSWIP